MKLIDTLKSLSSRFRESKSRKAISWSIIIAFLICVIYDHFIASIPFIENVILILAVLAMSVIGFLFISEKGTTKPGVIFGSIIALIFFIIFLYKIASLLI